MFKSVEINKFRCFDQEHLNDLQKINLIAGMNNTGKTSLLEALYILCGPYQPQLAFNANAFRGLGKIKFDQRSWMESPWLSLFHNFSANDPIKMTAEHDPFGNFSVQLRIISDPDELSELSGHLKLPLYGYSDNRSNMGISELSGLVETAKVFELEYKDEQKHSRHLSYMTITPDNQLFMTPAPPPPFPKFFYHNRLSEHSNLEDKYSKFVLSGKQDIILDALKIIEDRLEGLSIIVVSGDPVLHGDIGLGRPVPLAVMGAGMIRIAELICNIGNAPSGVVIIDEIENGLHYSILPKVWDALFGAATIFNTQIFATTHSRECIQSAFSSAYQNNQDNFRFFRLDRTDNHISAIAYDKENLETAFEWNLEVR